MGMPRCCVVGARRRLRQSEQADRRRAETVALQRDSRSRSRRFGFGRRIWLEFHFVSPTGRNGRRTECDGRSRGLKPTETSRPSREPALPDRGVQTGSKRSGRVGDLPAESQARSIRELDAPREAAKRI